MFLSNPKRFLHSIFVSEEVVLDNIPALLRCKIGLEKATQCCRRRIVLAFDIPKDKVSVLTRGQIFQLHRIVDSDKHLDICAASYLV